MECQQRQFPFLLGRPDSLTNFVGSWVQLLELDADAMIGSATSNDTASEDMNQNVVVHD